MCKVINVSKTKDQGRYNFRKARHRKLLQQLNMYITKNMTYKMQDHLTTSKGADHVKRSKSNKINIILKEAFHRLKFNATVLFPES